MGLLNRIKMLWRAAVGSSYSWPAMDIVLPGERYLHLVGSIHMGTRDMAPPPAKLLKKIRQADAAARRPAGARVLPPARRRLMPFRGSSPSAAAGY